MNEQDHNRLESIIALNDLARKIHKNAIAHGWWEEPRRFPEISALIVSEISEALEEYRDGRAPGETYYDCPEGGDHPDCIGACGKCKHAKPCGMPSELADAIIRILDYCAAENIDIQRAIIKKHNFNSTRPFRHGGKIC